MTDASRKLDEYTIVLLMIYEMHKGLLLAQADFTFNKVGHSDPFVNESYIIVVLEFSHSLCR